MCSVADSSAPPVSIGPIVLRSPMILAPLAGYTDLPFRLLCREQGASLCFSEMVSCHGLTYKQKNTIDLMQTVADERPFGVQLFGSDPDHMGEAAAIASSYPIDLIDLNMGCPVRKVTKRGSGCALMKDLRLAQKIIETVCANTTLPVTVKFRSGWTEEQINGPEFAAMAETAGAAAVTIHARTWAQGFGGLADRKIIKAVKEAVRIPVIGNGDILVFADGLQMMAETGCDAVMVGRGALGNPWVFASMGQPATLLGRLPVILRYLELSKQYLPVTRVLFKIKNHTSRFLTGLHGATRLRQLIYAAGTVEEIIALLLQHSDSDLLGDAED